MASYQNLPNLTTLPAVGPLNTICIVNNQWYVSNGAAWVLVYVSQDFTIYSGDSRSLPVTVTNGSGGTVNITGAQSIVWVVVGPSGNVLLTKTLAAGQIALTNPTAGICTITLLAADTSQLTGTYAHECRMVDVSGNSSIIFTGNLTVTKAYI